eukprot:scaffold266223_cov19-Tisochrysis_lutea.AAC.1
MNGVHMKTHMAARNTGRSICTLMLSIYKGGCAQRDAIYWWHPSMLVLPGAPAAQRTIHESHMLAHDNTKSRSTNQNKG